MVEMGARDWRSLLRSVMGTVRISRSTSWLVDVDGPVGRDGICPAGRVFLLICFPNPMCRCKVI